MEIKSNISEVIGRLKAHRAAVDAALLRAIAPERWFEELQLVAEQTLLSEAGAENAELARGFLDFMGSAFLGTRSQWWMGAPRTDAGGALGDLPSVALRAMGGGSARSNPTGAGVANELDLLDRVTVKEAMALIKAWAEEGGKDLTEEDRRLLQMQGQFDNELVERLWHIFGIHPGSIGRFDVQPGQQEAIESLTPHIVEFFGKRGLAALDPETVDLWLRRVLAAWTGHMTAHLPEAVNEEFKTAAGQSAQ